MLEFFAVAVLLLLTVILSARWILGIKVENALAAQISGHIHDGAKAFLSSEYKVMFPWIAVLFIVLALLTGYKSAIAFLAGALFSIAAGYIGMQIATLANVRTTEAARRGSGDALSVAFSAGSVMGMTVVAFGLLGLGLWFLFLAVLKKPEALLVVLVRALLLLLYLLVWVVVFLLKLLTLELT